MPFVVFIAAPELNTLRAMHKAVVDAGLTTKVLTVRPEKLPGLAFLPQLGKLNDLSSATGKWFEEDGGRECQDPPRLQPLLWPDHRQQQPRQGFRHAAGRRRQTIGGAAVGPSQLGLLKTSLTCDLWKWQRLK